MSLRTSFRQALRISDIQKAHASAGNCALYNGQASRSWLNSSAGYSRVMSRSFNKAAVETTGPSTHKSSDKKTGKPTGGSIERPPFEHTDPVVRLTKGLLPDGQDPVNVFKTHLKDGTLTRPLAASCLKTAVRTERYDGGLGETAIKWFWKNHDDYKFPDDTDLLDCIVRLLLREGKEDLLWSWIQQKSRKAENLGPVERFAWRSDTVRSIITAKAFASNDSLDSALETYFRAKSSTYSIPITPALTQCAKMLMMPAIRMSDLPSDVEVKIERPRWPNTSPELWEKFFKTIDAKRDVSEPFRVQLPLYRPDKPDPVPFLKYSRQLSTNPTLVSKMLKRESLVPWLARSRHAVAVLRQQGRDEDANWLGGFTHDLDSRSQVIRTKREERRDKQRKMKKMRDEAGQNQ